MATVKERLDKHEREIAAIRELIKAGMRRMVETPKDLRTLAAMHKELKEFAGAQKRTDAAPQSFIDSMRRGGNGHKKGWAPA